MSANAGCQPRCTAASGVWTPSSSAALFWRFGASKWFASVSSSMYGNTARQQREGRRCIFYEGRALLVTEIEDSKTHAPFVLPSSPALHCRLPPFDCRPSGNSAAMPPHHTASATTAWWCNPHPLTPCSPATCTRCLCSAQQKCRYSTPSLISILLSQVQGSEPLRPERTSGR
jgi:hypothetical protein